MVGEPVHRALPIIMTMTALVRAAWRPKMSAICAQKGMKAAEVRLKAEMIQFCCVILLKSLAIHGKALAILQTGKEIQVLVGAGCVTK